MTRFNEQEIFSLLDLAKQSRSETHNIEFKKAKTSCPKDLWRTISAFSHNPEGGAIVFGVSELDNSIETTGADDVSQLQEQISSYFQDRMENAERPDIRVLEYDGAAIVAVIVKETPSEKKPCYERNIGLPNGACVRVGNTNRAITFEETRQFLRNAAPYKYDKVLASNTTTGMLSQDKLLSFLQKSALKTGRTVSDSKLDEKTLKNLGILGTLEGVFTPTVAGFLIFSAENPQDISDFSRYVIRCVRYGGVTAASPIVDRLEIRGTLDQQIDEMYKFILKNTPSGARVVETKLVTRYEYPPDAIRELVANAIIHRDYQATGTFTQVSIFSNRIEITNPGNLPPGVSIENIKDAQFSRNEVMASLLKDLDYLEEYGRGIDIVVSRMESEGLLPPVFKNISNCFKVVLLGRTFENLNERQILIWKFIQDRSKTTTRECMVKFRGVSRATISGDLNKLIAHGLVGSRGSTNNLHYVAEY